MITFDANLLNSYFLSRSGVSGGSVLSSGGGSKPVPTPPWDPKATAGRAPELVRRVMAGSKFVNVAATQLDVPGSSEDYKKLFALYQGLNTLYGIAEQATGKGLVASTISRMQAVFARGMDEIGDFTDTLQLDQLRLARGDVATSLRGETGVRRDKAEYVTGVIHSGSSTSEVTAFQGPVVFDIAIKRGSTTTTVNIDLSQMGGQSRTLANVVNFINGKLQTAGMFTRFATERLPNEPRTVQVGDKTVTLPAGPDRWAWKVKGDLGEQVTFSAPATSGAVYLAQRAGKAPTVAEATKGEVDDTERQLLKFQTDTVSVPAVEQEAGEANWVAGRVFSQTLGDEVKAVRATATGPDGSVYLLADVDAAVEGEGIKGSGDVALMKYDSAGNLIFSRTLGAADAASGYGLAVASDGKVAIVGSVAGGLEGATEGPMDSGEESTKSDSFVTLFNADGEELWTVRRGAREEDEASEVAFGADGTVYIAGRTRSALPGATSTGGWDGYVSAYATQSTGSPRHLFTQQFGTAGEDRVGGIAVEGARLVVAGVENGSAVLRGFDIAPTVTSGYVTAATATANGVRDLGAMGGGDVAGVAFSAGQVIVAGATRNTLSAGTATSAHGAATDAFVARLSSGLSAQGSDRIAYLGGDADDGASALTVSGGQVWIAGSSTSSSFQGSAKVGTKDGFLAQVDIDAGAALWSRRFTAAEGTAAPTSLAVDATGVSVLDRMGLPKGTLDFKDSTLITAATSARAGDQFFIRAREGARPVAITIAANETLDSLAVKVRRAAGFSAKVDIQKSGDFARLRIQPLNDRSTVEIIAGADGRDALESLGLKEGVVRSVDNEDERKVYGLGFANDLSVATREAAKLAMDQIGRALGKIRTAYRDLEIASRPKTTQPPDISGPVPAYLKNQLANYQAALTRLSGG